MRVTVDINKLKIYISTNLPDVEQKPHILNIQILLLRQKCMQFIIGIKITLPADRDTLRQRYPLIYIQEYSPPQW